MAKILFKNRKSSEVVIINLYWQMKLKGLPGAGDELMIMVENLKI
jgi:hypothetical protein